MLCVLWFVIRVLNFDVLLLVVCKLLFIEC